MVRVLKSGSVLREFKELISNPSFFVFCEIYLLAIACGRYRLQLLCPFSPTLYQKKDGNDMTFRRGGFARLSDPLICRSLIRVY
jgi:hypothetical protein